MKRFGNKEMEGCEYLRWPFLNETDCKLSNEMHILTFS